MSNGSTVQPLQPDTVRLIAAQRGLGRALALSPDMVMLAAERASRPLAPLPDPATEPAHGFDPARAAAAP